MLASVARSEKHLKSKGNFNTFLQLRCSNFRLNCVKGLTNTKIMIEINFEGVLGELEGKKVFPETTIDKMLETNSRFYVK